MVYKNLKTAIIASINAGKEILKIYNTDFSFEIKSDNSPLTLADKNANKIICSILEKTNIPILSEEGKNIDFSERMLWENLWIVDPLDGTKEFIKKNGEFTVNIALVNNNIPIMGVIFVPVSNELYFAEKNIGSFKTIINNVDSFDVDDIIKSAFKLPTTNTAIYSIVASRSHLNDETKLFIENKENEKKIIETISKGSSLKFCLIAEGKADIYPRFGPTMEWDTAAGQAIAMYSGAKVYLSENKNNTLLYNKENLLNPYFIVEK